MSGTEEKSRMLIGVINEIGLNPYAYSGRGMYGEKCIGFTTDREIKDCVAIALILEEGNKDMDVRRFFDYVKTDSMGRSTVVYFPEIPWPKDEEDDDDEE